MGASHGVGIILSTTRRWSAVRIGERHYELTVPDLVELGTYDFEFTLGKPFTPFQQLLGVLPSLSMSLLPDAYARLMISEGSIIREFYPEKFDIDNEGKKYPWEGVVLIPFIDETKLLVAYNSVSKDLLSEEEKVVHLLCPHS